MLTVGLSKELFFIAHVLKNNLKIELSNTVLGPLKVEVSPDGWMDVWYKGNYIWHELIEGNLSFFGVESTDSISRIMACIDNNDPTWETMTYGIKK